MIDTQFVPSPCRGDCRLDAATGWCAGCYRSMAEITAWPTVDDRVRAAILAVLPARRRSVENAG